MTTNNLQPIYDILGEAFKAGEARAKSDAIRIAESYRQSHIKTEYGLGWEAAIDHIVTNGELIPESPAPETAASVLFPLAARMEEIVTQIIRETHQFDIGHAKSIYAAPDDIAYGPGWNAAIEHIIAAIESTSYSLPSAPERET